MWFYVIFVILLIAFITRLTPKWLFTHVQVL